MIPSKKTAKTSSSSALPSTDPPPFDVSTSTAQECLIALCGEDHSTEAMESILSHRPEIMLSSQSLHHYKTALLCDSTSGRLKCLNDAIESSRQECLIALCGEDHSTEAVEFILSHPEIMRSSQSLLHYKTALLCDSTTGRLKCLNDAVESSRQALALSPNSISFALFHAVLRFQLARNDAGSYDAVVQECDHALLIQNPTEPGYKVPVQASRLEKIREVIVELAEKSKCRIIVLEGGNRRDKWKRLVEDNSLVKVKAEFEGAQLKKWGIPGRRAPPDFDLLAKKKNIKKHKEFESNDVATISRVRAFWNDKMSVKEKRKLLRIGIEDLKVYFDKNKFRMAKKLLTEAIDYTKAKKIWRFWACSYCEDRVLDPDIEKHLMGHIPTLSISDSCQSLLPDGAPEWAIHMVKNGIWKPVELISASATTASTADWPNYVEDSERAEMIKRIRAKLQLFTGRKCLVCSTLDALQNLIIELLQKNHNIPKSVIMDLWLHETPQLICSLEAPELNLVLQLLEGLEKACALHCLGDIISEEDVRGNNWFWGNTRESVFFSSDLSALLFDVRFLRGETVEPDNGIAVLTSINAEDFCVADCDSDAFVSWLWTEGPTIGEQIKKWKSLRKASQRLGMKLLCSVDENRKRGYVSLLFKRWKELESKSEDDDGAAAELDIIWSIMKELEEVDFEIQMAIHRQKNRLAQKLYQLDVIIAATCAAMGQTGLKARMITMFDYRFALVPQLKSFMKAQLEDLANKDAAEISNPTSVPVVGSSEQQHPSQSGSAAPLPVRRFDFGPFAPPNCLSSFKNNLSRIILFEALPHLPSLSRSYSQNSESYAPADGKYELREVRRSGAAITSLQQDIDKAINLDSSTFPTSLDKEKSKMGEEEVLMRGFSPTL
ncbi:uncharacterized protein LOC132189511 [Corylus avellana]|uniref:uncharacterized protein LOC132189511 n=1 Tax=Corylus avellana TaxID=13451 RepID=UPI00286ADA07|nr:uncharacterized protein LOC132189511 [Corylus avellana]